MANYTVKSGDTLGAIAKANKTTVAEIAKANNISNVNLIKVGQQLSLGGQPTATPTVTAPKTDFNVPASTYDVKNYRSTLTALTTPAVAPVNKYNTTIKYNDPSKFSGQSISMPKAPTSTITMPTVPKGPQSTLPTTNQSTVPYGPVQTPKTTTPAGYVVVAGDSLSKIASRNGMTVQQLQALNPDITNPNMIRVGQNINLGGATPSGPVQGPVQNNPSAMNVPSGNAPTPTNSFDASPEQIREQESQNLARKAGEAGLSVSEYQTLMQSQNSVSKEETDAIAKELGITALEGEVFKKPKESTQKMFDTAYKTAGLADIKKQIETINADIDKDRADLAEATGQIDENPFLTETSRVGRGKRVLDQAETKINNKLAQAKTLQDLYDSGIGEITKMIERDKEDFGINQAIDQAKLNYLVKKAEIEAKQMETARSSSATSTFLSSRAGSGTPDVIGNSETGYYKYDAMTKKFVQVISPVVKTDANDPDLFKPSVEQKALVGRFLNTPEGKALYNGQTLTSEDIKAINADPALFYAVLQMANENGIY
jgi:LysM repeat protein/transcriptional regulator with XRE-family HTH domain